MSGAPEYRPRIPPHPVGVGLIGAGAIARTAHLPAYAAWGVPVVAVASRRVESARALAGGFEIRTVHDSVADLLADPRIEVVDIATGPTGRVDLIRSAVESGKHVLAQKPLVVDAGELPRLREVLGMASERGLRVAVNQNGRWAPVWRLATLLVRQGAIGEVVGVTHSRTTAREASRRTSRAARSCPGWSRAPRNRRRRGRWRCKRSPSSNGLAAAWSTPTPCAPRPHPRAWHCSRTSATPGTQPCPESSSQSRGSPARTRSGPKRC